MLTQFVGKDSALRVLDWAARERIGHRAFVQLGGAELLRAAISCAVPSAVAGALLDSLLGSDDAEAFLERALRLANETLRAGAGRDAAEAQIATELSRRLQMRARGGGDAAVSGNAPPTFDRETTRAARG